MSMPTFAGATEQTPEFILDEVNVTALRYVSKDLDTPADIKVYTSEQLKATGADNLIEALKFSEGIMYQSMGPYGQANGSMTSKVAIRGMEKGTLVLMNGVPINMNGSYYLDQIPLDQVEKVEIVKGSGSVLYGSEAFGGVVNIITKKTVQNSVRISGGTQGQDHGLTMQLNKLSMTYNYKRPKDTGIISESLSGYGDSEKNNVLLRYRFDENVNLNYIYSRNEYPLYKKNSDLTLKENRDFTDTKHFLQLEHKQGQWSNKLFWNHQTLDNDKTTYTYKPGFKTLLTTEETKNNVWGLDTQKAWKTNAINWVAGFNAQHESYETTKALNDHSRDHYAAYLQWDTKVSDATRIILSAREDMIHTDDGQHLDAFCPQFQTLTKINNNSSWYTNVGKSFKMPTFTQLYKDKDSDFIPNPNLKPETGYNYEIGYKKHYDNSQLKIALFKIDVSDQIDWQPVERDSKGKVTKSQAQNLSGFRNAGIEVAYENKINNHMSYSLGSSFSNPEIQKNEGDSWTRTMGRIQLSGMLKYKNGPTTAALSAMYYGDRVAVDEERNVVDRKAMLPVNLHIQHEIAKDRTITFDIDNLLDRQDITTNGWSAYYSMPRSYKIGYDIRF